MDNTLKTLYIKAQENKIRSAEYLGRINDYAACLEIEYTDEKRSKYSILSNEFWKLDDEKFSEASKQIELITREVFIRINSGKNSREPYEKVLVKAY